MALLRRTWLWVRCVAQGICPRHGQKTDMFVPEAEQVGCPECLRTKARADELALVKVQAEIFSNKRRSNHEAV